MTAFEKYLLDKGFKPYDRQFINNKCVDVPCDGESNFSSLGKLYNVWQKDGIEIKFGGSEKGKPPTLVSPRPNVIHKNAYLDDNGNVYDVILPIRDDDRMNIMLKEYPFDVIYESLIKREIFFDIPYPTSK
jgi:hypothetical protein